MEEETCAYIYRASATLHKLVDLITHPLAQHETDRQLKFLERFLADTVYGFWMHNIPKLIPLYEALSKKIETIHHFHEPFQRLLRLSAITPLQMKFSDKTSYFRDLQEYFSTLGYLVACLKDSELVHLVLDALLSLLTAEEGVFYQCSLPLKVCREAASSSNLPAITAQLSQLIDDEFYPKLLKIMVLVLKLPQAAQQMIEEDAVNALFVRFDRNWRTRPETTPFLYHPSLDTIPHFDDTCQVLWILLDSARKNSDRIKPPTLFALWSLEYALHWSSLGSARRHQRNNLMAIILKLKLFPNVMFVESGLADQILVFVSDRSKRLQNDRLDVHFRKLTWLLLYYFQEESELELIKAHRIVELLTQFVQKRPLDAEHGCDCEFMVMALELIPNFATYAYADFLWLNGPALICKKLRVFLTDSYDLVILHGLLYCFSEILHKKNPKIMNYIYVLGTVEIVTGVVEKLLTSPQLKQLHQNCLTRAFFILQELSVLDRNAPNNSLDLVMPYFKRVISPNENDSHHDINTIICAVDFLDTALSSNKSVFKEFHKTGGIYHLLDLIEINGFPVKVAALGALANIAQSPDCVPYLVTWRKNGVTVFELLLEIFRRQTEPICCRKQRVQFALKDNNFWINLCQHRTLTLHSLNEKQLRHCARLKICLVITALKTRFRRQVLAATDEYKMHPNRLSINDHLTMVFAYNYISLQLCKAWLCVSKEMLNEGLDPTQADTNFLCDNLQLIRNWQVYLQRLLEKIFKSQRLHQIYNELYTYNMLKEGRLADALDALQELRYISNCTERMFHMQKKLRMSIQIDHSRSNTSTCERYHRVLAILSFCDVCNQCTSLESDVIFDAKEEMDIEEVSQVENISFAYGDGGSDVLEDRTRLSC